MNLIRGGPSVPGAGLVIAVVVAPAFAVLRRFPWSPAVGRVLGFVAVAALCLGGAVIAVMPILVIVEQILDRRRFASWARDKGRQLPLRTAGAKECSWCGSRRVLPGDRTCPTCGRNLREEG